MHIKLNNHLPKANPPLDTWLRDRRGQLEALRELHGVNLAGPLGPVGKHYGGLLEAVEGALEVIAKERRDAEQLGPSAAISAQALERLELLVRKEMARALGTKP